MASIFGAGSIDDLDDSTSSVNLAILCGLVGGSQCVAAPSHAVLDFSLRTDIRQIRRSIPFMADYFDTMSGGAELMVQRCVLR